LSELQLSGVGKRFGDVVALNGLDLEVETGEFFCLFGPSAAGKTTTLRVIAGLERCNSGTVTFVGEDVTAAPVQGRDIGMIFQTFALYPHLSTHQNLAYPLREAGVSKDELERRVQETAEMLKISHTLKRKPATLSGGEQQRLAIGRALIRRPRLLLLDEPLTNLDAKLRHDTRAEFKRLHRELGITMIYATPDQLEALTMGQRIALIEEGRITQTGTPQELYATPSNPRVASLIGAPHINLIPGRVKSQGSDAVVELPFADLDAGRWSATVSDGDDILFGLRPHDIFPVREQQGPTFEARVHLTEPLGDITLIDLEANDTPIRMVLPESEALQYQPGDALKVELAMAGAHLFFRDTGTRID